MQQRKLKDPVDEKANEEVKVMSLEDITPETLPADVVRDNDPFATYPYRSKMVKTGNKIPVLDENDRPIRGKEKDEVICLTHVVLYNHLFKAVKNDPSNRRSIRTSHNRCIQDPTTEENHDLVFDRVFKTAKGEFNGCIIPNNALRAQCYFYYDLRTKRVAQDERYLLMDKDQGKPLRRLFQMIINPKLKIEAQADFISGTSEVDPGDDSPKE